MSDIIDSWSLFDRLYFVFLLLMFFSIPVSLSVISRKLDRIIRLLEQAEDNRDSR